MVKKEYAFRLSMRACLAVLFMLVSSPLHTQNSTVKGTVVDSLGEPVIGATVEVKGSNVSTITGTDGHYAIMCPSHSTLEFSYVGTRTSSVSTDGKNTIDVALENESQAINEVVMTVLGTKRQSRSLGYPITKVGGEDFQLARDPNIGNALSGKIVGVNAAGNGMGSTGTSHIIIRDNALLTSSNMPLYMVDGAPSNNTNQGPVGMWSGMDTGDGLNNTNTDDVENIQILKGAAASALYGHRGGNGAVLIATKSGKKNQPVTVELNEDLTVNSTYDHRDWQDVYGLGSNGTKPTDVKATQEGESSSWGTMMDGLKATNFLGNTYKYGPVDNWKNFYGTGVISNTSAAVSRSTQNVIYRFGAFFNKEKSILPNAGNRQLGFNMSTTYDIFKNLHLTVTVNYTFDKSNGRPNLSDRDGNTNAALFYRGSSFDITWMEGTEKGWGTTLEDKEMIGGINVYFNNPYWLQYRKTNDLRRECLVGSVNLGWDVIDWLYLQGAVQHGGYSIEFKQVQPIGAAADPKGWMTENEKNFYENNFNFLLGLNKTFGDWSLEATFGDNKQFNNTRQYIMVDGGRPLIVNGLWSMNNLDDRHPAKAHIRYRVNSPYGTADLGWKDRLFLNLMAHDDQFSALADDSNSHFYPSATLSWMFTDTFHRQLPEIFGFGKFRVGMTSASNGTSVYQNLLLYQLRNYKVNGQSTATQNNGSKLSNNTLKPVHISEFGAGLNLSFFQSHLNFDMAYHVKKTTDDIATVSTSSTSGHGSKIINAGKVKNNDFEFMVDAYPVRDKSFQWNMTLNFAYNNSNVEFLGGSVDRLSTDDAQSRNGNMYIYNVVGSPYGEIIGNKYKRNEQGQLLLKKRLPQAREQTSPGNDVYNRIGNWHNTFTYKNFALGFLLDVKFGAKIFSGTNYMLYYYGTHKEILSGRTKENLISEIVAAGTDEEAGKANAMVVSSQDYHRATARASIVEEFVYDANYIRLRELSLGYTFPKAMFSHVKFVKGLSFSIVACNLWTIMKHTPDIDPESALSASNGQELELNGYPATRNVDFNLNVKF